MAGCDPESPTLVLARKSFGGLYTLTGSSAPGAGAYYENPSGTPNIDEVRCILQLYGLPAGATSVKVRYTLYGNNHNSEAGPEVIPDGTQEYKWEIRSTTYTGVASADFNPGGQTTLQSGDVTGISMARDTTRNGLGTFEFTMGVVGGTDLFLMLVNVSTEGGYVGPGNTVHTRDFTAGDSNQSSRIQFVSTPEITIYGPVGSGLCQIIGPCGCLPWQPCPVTNILHDEFNRTTSSGWGTVAASFAPGNLTPTWDATDANTFTDGDEGVIHVSRPSIPIRDDHVDYGTTFATQDMLAILRTSRTPTANDFVAIYCGGTAPAVVIKVSGAVLAGVGGSDSMSHALDLTATIRVRLDSDGTNMTCAIWQDGSGEPSPQMTVPMDSGDALDGVTVQASLAVGSADMDVFLNDLYVEGCEVAADPKQNQPIEDELVGTGDGVTTVFYTRFPYNPVALEVSVGGIGTLVDPTDPAGRAFTFSTAPLTGREIRASYRYLVP